ncbi:M56 family metallopeptidase [Mucilaginibacter panaciglaebae]|uniref:Peptidase M56 domain-containing protein n=1 Tax=Mucilaginibacter panaciglaebae TaxID=502331 RepID=A0ABP7WBP5_9SPHI
MPALFIFLLKVNIALIAFCLGYYLVLRKLTFYTLNRCYLVLGIIFSSVYPFINIDSFIGRHQQLAPIRQVVVNLKTPAEKLLTNQWYWNWAAMIFWIGAAVFAMRLVVQFISLYRIYRRSEPGSLQQYEVRITDADISPFSFWRSIFINPNNIDAADLKSILQHEHVHVSQWHTLDILLAEISAIFYWFNPGIWLIKKAISENIEFITDRKILQQGTDSKAYQYSLLNVGLGINTSPGITTHFNFSTLKKRIRMMNARRSSKANLTRYALLIPTVVVCLFVFSISKAGIVGKSKVAYNSISASVRQIVGGPIAEVVIKAKKKRNHKFLVHLINTDKRTAMPVIFQFKNDSIAKKNLTFEVKKVSGQLSAYTINGQPVSAREFEAMRPHAKMDTINILAHFQKQNGIAQKRGFITFRDDVAGPPDNAPELAMQSQPFEGKNIEKVMLFRPDNDSAAMRMGKVIRAIRINGKKATPDDLKKTASSMIEKIRIVDDKKPPADDSKNNNQANDEKNKSIEITTKQQ